MKNVFVLSLICLISFFMITNLYAVRATPYPIEVTQSDGTTLTIRLQGNEFFHYKTTLDGYLLAPDKNGILTYASVDKNGVFTSSSIKARNIEKRTVAERNYLSKIRPNIDLSNVVTLQRSMKYSTQQKTASSSPEKVFPLNGTPKSLVILVNFKDLSFITSNPKTAFTNLLNQEGYSTNGGTGSARDFFHDNSMGNFSPEFDVVGPYTLPNNMAYYGENDVSDNDTLPQQMVVDACTLAAGAGVDFSQYDTDNDGFVDNVFVYYAGHNEAEGASANTIWPHRWTLKNYNTKFNGKIIYDYACTSELSNKTGTTMCGIGTFVHEFGHVLGLPDYYATDGGAHQTLSYWSTMDAGPYLNAGRTPPCYSAYDRFFLGWLTPDELKIPDDYILENLSVSNKAYLITEKGDHNLNGKNPLPREFFMLENRQQTGWDKFLPGHGMIITHIYYSPSAWMNNIVNNDFYAMGVDIVEADEIASDWSLSGDPFPGTAEVSRYVPILRDGTNIKKPLSEIQELDNIIKFRFGLRIQLLNDLDEFNTIQEIPSEPQNLTLLATGLTTNLKISFSVGLHFEMKKIADPETAWGKSITFVPVDSNIDTTIIQIRYNPTVPSYSNTHKELLMFQAGMDSNEIAIVGKSTRPIDPPAVYNAENITTGSFEAKWGTATNANGYYFTVYSIEDGTSEFSEGFDQRTQVPIGWMVKTDKWSESSVYSGKSIPAVQFSTSTDTIMTEEYVCSASKLSFYVRRLDGLNSVIFVEAKNQDGWTRIDSILVAPSLIGIKSYPLDVNSNYTRFRLTYKKVIGDVIIDDIAVGFNKKIEFIKKEVWTIFLSDTLMNLKSGHEYFYKVRGSRKDIGSDQSVLFEEISNSSETVSVSTLENRQGNVFRVKNDGSVELLLPTTDLVVNVYNIIGQKVKTIYPQSTIFKIEGLPKKQVYIIVAGDQRAKIMLF